MRRRTIATLLATTILGAMMAIGPSASAAPYTAVFEKLSIDTKFGKIYVEVTRPENNGKMVKGPAVVTLSPYSVLGRSNVAEGWVPEGYVHVWADVIGTGNSGGCYDYGGERERRTGYELVEWIHRLGHCCRAPAAPHDDHPRGRDRALVQLRVLRRHPLQPQQREPDGRRPRYATRLRLRIRHPATR